MSQQVSDALDTAPPQDLEAERAALGAALLDAEARAAVLAALTASDFHEPAHEQLFAFLVEMFASLEPDEKPDIVTIEDALKTAGIYEQVGGREALVNYCDACPAPSAAAAYARIVKGKADLRRAMQAGLTLARQAVEPGADAATVLEAFDRKTRRCRMAAGEMERAGGVLVNLGDVEAQPVRWLWPGRIPLGKPSLVAGDPNIGKSMITTDIAARESRGAAWPDGAANDGPGGVVVLTAEDDLADTVVPRLLAAGADMDRVRALAAVRKDGRERTFDLGRDLDVLAEAIRTTPDCRLVIVDPITAYLPGRDGNSNVEIRSVLAPLAALAAESGVAVVGVTHLRKGDGAPLYRIMGSLGFVAAARAVWAACKDQADPTGRRRFLLPCKNNLAPEGGGLAYRVEVLNGSTVPVVTWESEPVSIRLEDVLPTQGAPGPDPEAQREAEDFLRQALADGPRPAADVIREAAGLGVSRRTLYRGRKNVGVRTERQGGIADKGAWMWRLG